MYTEAFTYPFEGENSTERLLIGSGIVLAYGMIYLVASVLSLVFIGFLLYPLLLVPVILLYGYSMAIFDTTIDGESTAPSFDDWEELAVQGARMFGLIFVYQIPIWVLFFGYVILVIGVSAGIEQAASNPIAGQAMGGLTVGFFLLFAVLSLAMSYVLPAALCATAANHSFSSGFDVDKLKASLTSEYAIGWVLAAVVYVFLGTIGTIFSFLLVGVPILFYTIVVGSRLVAIGYREALSEPTDSDTDTAGQPVGESPDGI
jgi:hypothetical protein